MSQTETPHAASPVETDLRELALAAQSEAASPSQVSAFVGACSPDAILALLNERDAALARAKNASGTVMAALQAQAIIDGVLSTLRAERDTAVAALAEEKADAERWRFVRTRLEVNNEEMLSGKYRSTLQTVIGKSALGVGWPRTRTAEELDAAIDAARLTSTEKREP
ncbi:MAG: hypothetical protein JWL61_4973 [Gemmatimonadetes bacterium]|nr:hypothetical protein [Gemmatimonadota bacterium]